MSAMKGDSLTTHFDGMFRAMPKVVSTYTALLNISSTWSKILSGDVTQLTRVRQLSQLVCGSSPNLNDLGLTAQFIEQSEIVNFTELLRRVNFTPTPESGSTTILPSEDDNGDVDLTPIGRRKAYELNLCPTISYLLTWPPAAKRVGRLRHLLFGQVAYYPQTQTSSRLVHRVSAVYRLLDDVRELLPVYFNTTRPWLLSRLSGLASTHTDFGWRDQLKLCSYSSLFVGTQLADICWQVWKLTSPSDSQSKGSSMHWSQVLDGLDWYVGVLEEILNCLPVSGDRFLPFTNLTEFNHFLEASQSDRLHAPIGVVFEGLDSPATTESPVVSVVLRHNPVLVDTTYKYKVLDRYQTPIPRRDPDSDMKYFTSGFIDLQELIGRAFISLTSPIPSKPDIGVQMQLFPSPPFLQDRLFSFFTFSLPQLMVLSWSFTVVSAVKHMVDEKEHGLFRILVTILGVPRLLIWAAWFTVPLLLAGTTSLVLILVLKFGGIFTLADVSLLYSYQLSYIISVLAYSAICASLFTRANLAAVFAGCCYFICFVPAPLLQRYESFLSREMILAGSLLPQVSHTFGWSHLVRMEADISSETGAPVGAQWSNVWYSGRGAYFSMVAAFSLLWVTTFLQFSTAIWLIPWILEVKLWLNAQFSELYVALVRAVGSARASRQATGSCPLVMNDLDDTVSDLDRVCSHGATQASIVVDRVSKRYRYSRNLALDNVSLKFYPNEIGVLLGHNGTGKTTMISILSGSLQTTQGSVFISGVNTSRHPELARRKIGYCPQHEVLYSELTVQEHIHFYGTLKDLGKKDLNIDSRLDKFGFAEKCNTLTKHLSGGQRRRLSVCLAFLGSPSVVLLDEPTASVDPLYKRVIWDTILSMRGDDRTILLSTHHMGEADFLADRIAILACGRVCSLSTSMALKAKYSEGYRLLLEQGRHQLGVELDILPIMNLITSFVPQARLLSRKQNSLVILLPSCGSYEERFVPLFEHLEAILIDKHLPPGPLEAFTRFSVTDATLDDVFLAVSDRTHCKTAEVPQMNSTSTLPRESNHITAEADALLTSDNTDRIKPRRSLTGTQRRPSWHLLSQFALVVQTRCYHLLRNKLLWLFEFLLPCLIFLLSVIVATVYQPEIEQPAMDLHPWLMTSRKKVGSVSFFANVGVWSESADLQDYLHTLSNPFSWTGPACLPHGYVGRPLGFIPPCRLDFVNSSWNPAYDEEKDRVPHKARIQVPPYRRLPTSDWLLNLTTYNISQFLNSHTPLPLTGDIYGGISLVTGNRTSDSASLTLSNLFFVIREWLVTAATQATVNGTNASSNRPPLASSFSMNLSEVLQLLLPPTHQLHVWYNNKGYAAAPAYLNLLHNLELRLLSGSSLDLRAPDRGLVVTNYPQPFPKYSWTFSMRDSMMLEAGFVLFFLLALSSIPGNFAVLLVSERQLGIKHLQRVSGLRPVIYWLANFFSDFFVYLFSTMACVLILIAFNKLAYVAADVIGPFICILLLFQSAMITFVHLTTFCFHKPSTAYVVISAVNVLISSLTTSVSLLLEVFSLQEPSLRYITVMVQRCLLIFPHYCLGSAIYDLAVVHFLRQHDLMTSVLARQFIGYQSSWHLIGFRLVCLMGQTLVFSLCILFVEHHDGLLRRLVCSNRGYCKRFVSWISRLTSCPPLDWMIPVASCERQNVRKENPLHIWGKNQVSPEFPQAREKLLCLNQLSKRYRGQTTYAISRLDLQLKSGECFGLLGTNGSGKSTTFALLTGQYSVSPESVLMNGSDLATQPVKAHRSVGYCPQGHALHPFLTIRETLYRYARLRCLRSTDLPRLVTGWLETFGMSLHADRLVSRLSGGTKRKLSSAIAFIGNPTVLLLDEPSNGMDPASKRLFWLSAQAALRQNRSVLISSHCMQECESLCNRIALLDNGRIQCEGTPLELKTRFGVGYVVELELTTSFVVSLRQRKVTDLANEILVLLVTTNQLSTSDITCLRRPGTTWTSAATPSSYRLQFQFSGHGRLSQLFSVLRSLRQDLAVVHRYSVKAGTLEDAFIGFVWDSRSGPSGAPLLKVKSSLLEAVNGRATSPV